MDKASVQRILERHEQGRSNQRGQRALFTRENLQGFNFAGRDLIGMQFVACDLRGAVFQGCNLSFSQFTCCDLRTADLRNVKAASVSFHGSDLREADMGKVFTGIDSSFSAADLRGARMEGAHFKKTEFHGAWMDAADLKGVWFEEAYAPSGKPIDGTIDSRSSSAELADKLQRRKPLPEMAKSPIALAYEQGSGPALLDRLEAAERLEAAPEKGDKVSLADLRGKAQGEQPERQTTKDRGLER
jgi:uncharacterized protein YjbI with pentapeptide repeats